MPASVYSLRHSGDGSRVFAMQMNFVLRPWHMLFLILAGWVNRRQQLVIESLRTENQVLTERWRQEYNSVQPHSSLGYRPTAFTNRMVTHASFPGTGQSPSHNSTPAHNCSTIHFCRSCRRHHRGHFGVIDDLIWFMIQII